MKIRRDLEESGLLVSFSQDILPPVGLCPISYREQKSYRGATG